MVITDQLGFNRKNLYLRGGLAKDSIIEGRDINLVSLSLGRIFEDLRCNSNTENTFKIY